MISILISAFIVFAYIAINYFATLHVFFIEGGAKDYKEIYKNSHLIIKVLMVVFTFPTIIMYKLRKFIREYKKEIGE